LCITIQVVSGSMDIKKIAEIIQGEIICAESAETTHVDRAFASDLMSDVLTLNTDSLLLVTGLSNMQTIRTAEMAEIKNILFVRNKKPSKEMIHLAQTESINIIVCNKSMFATCGELYKAGLKPVY
jgi:hypothetical protein